MVQSDILQRTGLFLRNGLGAPMLLIIMISMIVLPLPAIMLDMFFTFNISLALVVLLAGIYALKPLEFSIFPTILLVSTLLRLGLNIASTRMVLLDGHTGTDAAGKVIQSFGEVVIGGNFAVGFVVFIILVIINFVVVTKGAGRISEVAARFTLDAMPGKQMGVDADLNSGLISQEEAIARRSEINQEADFYGSMDGASKFVRGDAIAGILILIINLIGGLTIGAMQHGLSITEAFHVYGLLTVGDGLVAQVPSLLLSTAAAIMVTRVSSAQDMNEQITSQMFDNPKVLYITAFIVGALGIIPGMPHVAFLMISAVCAGIGFMIFKKQQEKIVLKEQEIEKNKIVKPESRDLSWDDVKPVDIIGLQVGYRLISMVDKKQGGQLMGRIKGVRKKLSQELGYLIPSVHIRDNLDLDPNTYRITFSGVTLGEAQVYPDMEMAINPGQVFGTIKGIETKDPAFGLEAFWIEPANREQAQTLGYTVVDASTVIATHLSHIIGNNAAELLGHEEVTQILDRLGQTAPKLIEDIKSLPLGVILRVMQNLLIEHVPLRDTRSILEAIAEIAPKSQDPGVLTAHVRMALGRLIAQNINGVEEELPVITLDPQLEQILQKSFQAGQDGGTIEPGLAERLQQSLAKSVKHQEAIGQPSILVVSGPLRPLLSRFLRQITPNLNVLSYQEIPDNKQIRVVASIGQ